MNQVIVVSVHSVVDLITNSSSELFVAETSKSVETVKTILRHLVDLRNQIAKLSDDPHVHDTEKLFENMFKEPIKMDFGFQPEESGEIWKEFQRVHSAWRADEFSRIGRHPVYERCRREWDAQLRQTNPAKQKSYDDVWSEWNLIEKKAWSDMIIWACDQAGIQYTKDADGLVSRVDFGRYGSPTEGDPRIAQICDALSWDYSFKKGDVIIQSADDNSIPYEMFDDIERIFNAHQRRHLG